MGQLSSGHPHGFSQWPGQPLTQTIHWRGTPGSGESVGGLLGAENQHRGVTVFSCCRLESETGHPKSEEKGSYECHPSPSHAPVILPTRWATFSAQLCFSREKFLTFENRVGTFQMGPHLAWSQGPWSLDLHGSFIHVATDMSLPSLAE